MPEGKIDYRTALDIAEKIKDPERQVEVATQLAEERMPRDVAREVIRRAADRRGRDAQIAQIVQEATREPRASLAFTHRHYQAVVSGEKQQTTRRRADPRIEAGTVVRADVIQFADLEITEVIRKRLSEFTEDDAQARGRLHPRTSSATSGAAATAAGTPTSWSRSSASRSPASSDPASERKPLEGFLNARLHLPQPPTPALRERGCLVARRHRHVTKFACR